MKLFGTPCQACGMTVWDSTSSSSTTRLCLPCRIAAAEQAWDALQAANNLAQKVEAAAHADKQCRRKLELLKDRVSAGWLSDWALTHPTHTMFMTAPDRAQGSAIDEACEILRRYWHDDRHFRHRGGSSF